MNTPEISIIVPVYNMELYLAECLDSIIAQTFTDWECILVDDGSTDSSYQIIQDYVVRDSRFKVLQRKNGGLSAARNSALEIARGKYIGFVDSDDWLSPQMYEVLYNLASDNDADFAQVCMVKEYKGITHSKSNIKDVTILNHREVVRELCYSQKLPSYMCNKLFRRSIMTELFPVGMVFEDILTMTNWAKKIQKGVLSPLSLYHYRYRKGSITHTKSPKFRLQHFDAVLSRFQTFEQSDPEAITPAERAQLLWKAALLSSKFIARMTNQQLSSRLEALQRVSQQCLQYLPEPDRDMLKPTTYRQVMLLINNPKRYIRNKVLGKMLDLHSMYRNSRAYD